MDNTGRRFKTENDEPTRVLDDEPTRVFEAEYSSDSARDKAKAEAKAERAKEKAEKAKVKTERQKAKEAKSIEKLMQKERIHERGRDYYEAGDSETAAAESAPEEAAEDIKADIEPNDKAAEAVDSENSEAEKEPAEKAAKDEAESDNDTAEEKGELEKVRRRFKEDERLKDKNSKKLDKLMHKNKRREEHSDREVLSYEDMPLEESDGKEKSPKKRLNKKRITVAVIIFVVLIFIVYIFTNNDKLSLHNIANFVQYGIFNSESDQRFPISVQGENISAGNFRRMGQDLCYASDTKLQTLNNYGKRMLTVQHGFTSPVMVCSSKYSLLYNLGGTGFQVNGLENSVYSDKADHNIIVADINNNGTYALVTQSDGYLSKVSVYDKDSTFVYSYSFASYYITSVTLNSNGRKAVLSGVSALNGSEISSLYVLDFYKDSPQHFVELEDTIIYDVQYLNDNYVAAVGNTGAYSLNTGNGYVEKTSYEGKTLTAYDMNTDTNTFSVSLSRSGDGRNCDIYSFNTNGTLSKSFSTEQKVLSLSTYKGRVALLTSDNVYLYDKGGNFINKTEAGIDPTCVVLYTSSDAYVLDTSEIRSVSM